jgi:hypothetical protein
MTEPHFGVDPNRWTALACDNPRLDEIEALDEALAGGKPVVFNSDQGAYRDSRLRYIAATLNRVWQIFFNHSFSTFNRPICSYRSRSWAPDSLRLGERPSSNNFGACSKSCCFQAIAKSPSIPLKQILSSLSAGWQHSRADSHIPSFLIGLLSV